MGSLNSAILKSYKFHIFKIYAFKLKTVLNKKNVILYVFVLSSEA